MFEIVCFDVCALAILLTLLFAIIFRDIISDDGINRLVILILVTIFVGVFDIVANVNDGNTDRIVLNYFSSGSYHVLRNITFYLYNSYIVFITATRRNNIRSVIGVLRYSPIFAVLLIAVITPVTHYVYFYDEAGRYMRGRGFALIYLFTSVYAIAAFYIIIKNISILGRRKSASLMSCAVFSFAASIVQYSRPYLVIDILGFTLSILFIVLFVDNPGDKIDENTTLMNNGAYMNELKVVFYSNSPVDIIHINITNNKILEEMLSYTSYLKLARNISIKLRELNINTNSCAKLYYIKNGRYRVILDKNVLIRTDAFAKEALEIFNSSVSVNGTDVTIESSVCISQCPEDFNIFDNFLDFGAVASKFEKSGKIIYSKEILKTENYDAHCRSNKLVEEGLANNRFEIFYEPMYNINSKDYKEVDIRVSLKDTNNKKQVDEDVFLEAAEQSGSIIELGEYVFEEVCKFISSDDFKKMKIDRVIMKLSTMRCMQNGLADSVFEMLDKYSVSPEQIRFKLTESIASDNQVTFADNIKKLSERGVKFALDNYGSGYSNIITLSTMPIDMVIIDNSFAGGEISERANLIFDNSVRMLKSLGKKVAFDGIDDTIWENRLRALGCDYLKGNAYAGVMTVKELADFYEKLEA